LSLCALALTERQAHAWVNCKFSIGLNWSLQSGNNNLFWGLFKNGQVPGPEAFGGGGPFQYGPFMPPAGQTMPFPYFGQNQQQPTPQAMPQAAPAANQNTFYYLQNQGWNPYQTVSYQPNGYYYPSSFYPTYYNAYAYQAPYYWYQGR
jgi:hypothetical protein